MCVCASTTSALIRDGRIRYIPREKEKGSRVEKREGRGKDEGERGEGGVVRTGNKCQLSKQHWDEEKRKGGGGVEDVDQCGDVSLIGKSTSS